MSSVLPSTVVEINLLQNSMELTNNKGFENIPTDKQLYKREVSLPTGVEDWDLRESSYGYYLNDFMSDGFKVNESRLEDSLQLVPEEGDQRQRCESYSSVASSMDERQLAYPNFGIKSFNTVRMDSGSTCITSDHSYVCSDTPSKGLDPEETYQNLNYFFHPDHELSLSESVPSPLSSTDSTFEVPHLLSSIPLMSPVETTDVFQDSLMSRKRPLNPASEDCMPAAKSGRYSESPVPSPSCSESRPRNKSTPKTQGRKTRKEKQKEMDNRVMELEQERQKYLIESQVLEDMIKRLRNQLMNTLNRNKDFKII